MRWGWRSVMGGRGRRHHHCHGQDGAVLASCPTGSMVVVTGNAALQTVELGLYTGVTLEVVRNDPSEHLLAIQAGDVRLSLPRGLAENVFVEPAGAARHAQHLLREIRRYLQENGSVDTRSLAIHFEMQEDAMEAMLVFLAARGHVQRQAAGCSQGCGGCKGCGAVARPLAATWSLSPRSR
jgi:Fe2+ transport system protein FeoA